MGWLAKRNKDEIKFYAHLSRILIPACLELEVCWTSCSICSPDEVWTFTILLVGCITSLFRSDQFWPRMMSIPVDSITIRSSAWGLPRLSSCWLEDICNWRSVLFLMNWRLTTILFLSSPSRYVTPLHSAHLDLLVPSNSLSGLQKIFIGARCESDLLIQLFQWCLFF